MRAAAMWKPKGAANANHLNAFTEDELVELQEEYESMGERLAWRQMLRQCLQGLGYDEETKAAALIVEREEAVAALRSLCADFGDNDWEDGLRLVDVIEKHLARYLHQDLEGEQRCPHLLSYFELHERTCEWCRLNKEAQRHND
jgi:hypothetical protein